MGGNEDIAAQAVCLSTALSAFTLMLGIFILKTFSLI
jgi:predicted permease